MSRFSYLLSIPFVLYVGIASAGQPSHAPVVVPVAKHPTAPVAKTPAQRLWDELDPYFTKMPHTNFSTHLGPVGWLPIYQSRDFKLQYAGLKCSDDKKAFPALILQEPKLGGPSGMAQKGAFVFEMHPEKPLESLSDEFAEAMKLNPMYGASEVSNLMSELTMNQQYKQKQVADYIQFGEALKKAGILDNATSAQRLAFLRGPGKKLADQTATDGLAAIGNGNEALQMQMKLGLLKMTPDELTLWRDRKVELETEYKQLEEQLKTAQADTKHKNTRLAVLTKFPQERYDAVYGVPASPATRKKDTQLMTFSGHLKTSSLYEAKDMDGKLQSKMEIFNFPGGWAIEYSVANPKVKGGFDVYHCW